MPASGALLFLLVGAVPLQDGAAVDSAVRKFKSDYYRAGVREEDRVVAVGALAAHRCGKVARVLAPYLTKSPVSVRIVTARHLAGFSGIEGVEENLLSALLHYRNNGQRGVQVTVLQALGTLRASCAAEAVSRLVESPDIWVAKAAIEAAGKIRSASSVDSLVRALVRLDGPCGDKDAFLDPFEGELPATGLLQIALREAALKDRKRRISQRAVLREPMRAALKYITKLDFSGVKEWQEWWRAHKRNYVVPP
jgi:hypothetical protein